MNILSKYIGIPYVHKGRTMDGLDCWGLIKLIYRDLGYKVKDLDDYEMEGHLQGEDYFSGRDCDEWNKTNHPVAYDVVLIVDKDGIAYHAGMVTPEYKFIHCARNTGVVIMNMTDVKKILTVEGYYHLKARDGNNKI